MSAGLNILIADEQDSAQEAASLITRWGHRSKHVHDGLAAVDEARAFHPDLMLVALSLPGLNGLGVAKRIRQIPYLEHVKLTALVNESLAIPQRELKKAGFTDNLVKPAEPLELLTSIVKARDAIQRARQSALSAQEIVARSRRQNEQARAGLDTCQAAIASSRESLRRPLQGLDDQPPSPVALLETLISGAFLDAEHRAVARKALSAGEPSLLAWESTIFARVKQRYLLPVCKLCRYRIPAAEVTAAWSNGGYCALCAESLR